MPEVDRTNVEYLFDHPDIVHNYVAANPLEAARTEYLEHNGRVLGVKLVWKLAHKHPDQVPSFTTHNAKGRLAKLGFRNFISTNKSNLVTSPERSEFVLEVHKRVEKSIWTRDPGLRLAVIKNAKYACEACGLRPYEKYNGPQDGCLEGHHTKPISQTQGTSKAVEIGDLMCLCANCHSMIHRLISTSSRSVSLNEFRSTIKG
jgi:predicted HNH restriction endonuclease